MRTIILTEPEGYSKQAVSVLKTAGRVVTLREALRTRAFRERAEVLVVKLGMKISERVLARFPHVRIVATSTTGLNHIDTDAAAARGIHVLSLRGETKFLKTITPTAEEAVGLMIGLMRKLPWAFESVKQGKWEREHFYGRELFDRTLGIVGFGRLGRMVASYGHAFGMRVIAADPLVPASVMQRTGVRKVSLSDVFKKSDVVSLHVLLTPETEGMITERHFQLMRPDAYFINTARGELIDEHALLGALMHRRIAGAALDVLNGEDPSGSHLKHNPLCRYARTHDNLFIVPHIGGASFDAMDRTEIFIAEKVVRALKKGLRFEKKRGRR